MIMRDFHPGRPFIRNAIWMFVILTVYSCATGSNSGRPGLSPAPLPSYCKGTVFVYDDGSWETVVDTAPGMVTWTDHRNYISSGSPDFTYRRTYWETKSRSGTREFGARDDLFLKSDNSLWPLRAGNRVNYSETGTWRDKKGTERSYQTEWSCEVAGTERIAVMAGEFGTWKIVCKRYHVSKSRGRSQLREVKTWYYAPAVGHYVLTTSRYYSKQGQRRRELLAALPPTNDLTDEARRQMDQSFQHALEFMKSGEPARWSNSRLKLDGETVPINTFKTPAGNYSRRYVQKLNMPDGQRTYYGMAIRSSGGQWIVPRR